MNNVLERMMTTDSPEIPDRLVRASLVAGTDAAPTALESICRRIMNLNEQAGNHEHRLLDLRDRLLTAEPRDEKSPNKQPEEVCGQVMKIERELARLERVLDHTTGVLVRLEEL